jgi:hypothetical protein
MQRVQLAQTAVLTQRQTTIAIKTKMQRLRAVCAYRNSADTVPTADSLAPGLMPQPDVPSSAEETVTAPRLEPGPTWNVLAEDYWDLFTLLMR